MTPPKRKRNYPPVRTVHVGFRIAADVAKMARDLSKRLPWNGQEPTMTDRVENLIRATYFQLIGGESPRPTDNVIVRAFRAVGIKKGKP